jgi:hypothetical protein
MADLDMRFMLHAEQEFTFDQRLSSEEWWSGKPLDGSRRI